MAVRKKTAERREEKARPRLGSRRAWDGAAGSPAERRSQSEHSNGLSGSDEGMDEIGWHRRETRRQTEKTNIVLEPRAHRQQKAGEQNPPESEGTQGQNMRDVPEWGRVIKAKQEGLPETVSDYCGGISKWSHHPAWTERMRAALKTRRGSRGKWFSLIDRIYDPRQLQLAWGRLDRRITGKARRRGAGVDGVTVEKFAERAREEVSRLGEELKAGKYRPRPVRRHWIPKPGTNKKRPLGLPCVRDKVVQEALRSLIEPIFESEFLEGSHGFRPNRSTDTACRHLEAWLRAGKVWVVDADITGCYDNIDQERLLDEVNRRIADGAVLKLIKAFLKAGVMEEMKVQASERGTPQGGIVSALLANIYLHALDEKLESRGIAWVRYADDFLLLCGSREEAEATLETVREILKEMGLSLSPEKTRLVHLDEGFDFLGWHYQGRQRWPRKKSVDALRLKLREKTRRLRPGSMEAICGELQPILRGWFNYFREGNSVKTFRTLSGWLRRRLRSILHRRHKGKGIGSRDLNRKWPNRCFTSWGLFQPDVALECFRSANHATSP